MLGRRTSARLEKSDFRGARAASRRPDRARRSPCGPRRNSRARPPFGLSSGRDTYRDALMGVIRKKARGRKVTAPGTPKKEPAPDLMEALTASLDEAAAGRRARANGGGGGPRGGPPRPPGGKT